MSESAFIVLARAVHVLAGVGWAGTAFMLAVVLVPLAQRGADGAGAWLSPVARRAGPLSGICALLTVVSGVYLFAVLHPHDESAGALVLKAGAAAALLALAVGVLVGRPAGQRLVKLQAQQDQGTAPPPETLAQLSGLRRRAALSARLAAALLSVSVVAMAVFRYATVMA